MTVIGDEALSVHQITCRTGLDHRTVKKYINLIMEIQKASKVYQEQIGLRIFVRKVV